MITLQDRLEPVVTLEWKAYKPPAVIDWLHSERRELIVDEQLVPSQKLRETPLSAIFNISAYEWTEVNW